MQGVPEFGRDVAQLLGGGVLLLALLGLRQRRRMALVKVLAAQAAMLAAAIAWQGSVRDEPGLYVAALLAFGLRAVLVPAALRRLALSHGLPPTAATNPALGPGMMLALAVAAVGAAAMVAQTADVGSGAALSREDLALALAVTLLGLLGMAARRDGIGQATGLMGVESGVILAAASAAGMPMLIGILVALTAMTALALATVHLRHQLDEALATPKRRVEE
ncbi:hydrogenase-4 component E [Arenibaculum pallidiluteum]|uniref:hydrogenase-4 component E n=1 Tax=Arenibaculum pallidiluteum TaxID=2812559 RepID=UPI001A96A812|nr:hydrogenase-4 component E [Arenibaculum pallidiluteum]